MQGKSPILSLLLFSLSFSFSLHKSPLILDPSPSRGEGKERCIPFPPTARLPRQKTARKDGMGGLLTKGQAFCSPPLSLLNPSEMLYIQKGKFSECPIVK